MTDDEIGKIVSKILRREFKGLGFEHAAVASDVDFDGDPIIRVNARLKSGRAPALRLAKALQEIRSELIKLGEDRFVFLSSAQPDDEFVEEDVE
jgi:hypothetical protein